MENNTLKSGSRLKNGEYSIVRVLGQGGFGITYEAEQVSLGRKVAIKEFFMKDICNRDKTPGKGVFFPAAGYRSCINGCAYNRGSICCYWSSTHNLFESYGTHSLSLNVNSSYLSTQYSTSRACAYSVRCVSE